jgi:hypothetical protein
MGEVIDIPVKVDIVLILAVVIVGMQFHTSGTSSIAVQMKGYLVKKVSNIV